MSASLRDQDPWRSKRNAQSSFRAPDASATANWRRLPVLENAYITALPYWPALFTA